MYTVFKGTCSYCSSDFQVDCVDTNQEIKCPTCYEAIIHFRRVPETVYVIAAPRGKTSYIGITDGNLDKLVTDIKRKKRLNVCVKIASFPSERPINDLKKLDTRLKKYQTSRTEYKLDAVKASLEVYRALAYRSPIIYHKKTEELFKEEIENNRIALAKKLNKDATDN